MQILLQTGASKTLHHFLQLLSSSGQSRQRHTFIVPPQQARASQQSLANMVSISSSVLRVAGWQFLQYQMRETSTHTRAADFEETSIFETGIFTRPINDLLTSPFNNAVQLTGLGQPHPSRRDFLCRSYLGNES